MCEIVGMLARWQARPSSLFWLTCFGKKLGETIKSWIEEELYVCLYIYNSKLTRFAVYIRLYMEQQSYCYSVAACCREPRLLCTTFIILQKMWKGDRERGLLYVVLNGTSYGTYTISPFTCHKTHICLQILIRPSKKCMPNPKLPACSALNVTLCRVSHSCDKCLGPAISTPARRHESDKLVVQTHELLISCRYTKYCYPCSLINSDTLIQSTMCSAE